MKIAWKFDRSLETARSNLESSRIVVEKVKEKKIEQLIHQVKFLQRCTFTLTPMMHLNVINQ